MLQKKKAILAGAAVLSLLTATACSSSAEETSPSPKTTAAATVKPAEPVKVKLWLSDQSKQVPMGNVMENPTIKFLAENTNTILDIEWLTHTKWQEQMRLKFAAGETPDVYQSYDMPDDTMLKSGKVLPLNDLIEKYGQNLKKKIPQSAWDAVTYKGSIMSIPEAQEGNGNVARVMYMRKDWLDKLGLAVPKTEAELLNVLRAFREKDPNGNGKADEIPFTMRENMDWGDNLFGMFGTHRASYALINGEITPGALHPNMKKALTFFKTMYQEKLIDQEFLTNNRSVWEQKIKSDKVGVWVHAPSLVNQWQKDMAAALPDKKPDIIVVPTPRGEGITGPVGSFYYPNLKTFTIMKSAKNPEAIVKMFDWLASDEGQAFAMMGIKGDTYTVDNGMYVYNLEKDKQGKSDEWRPLVFTLAYNEKLQKDKLKNDAEFTRLNNAYAVAKSEGLPKLLPPMPVNKFADTLKTAFNEQAVKIIFGKAPLESWDEYVKTQMNQGAKDYIKELTSIYNDSKK
jgi:putative aldouronate transport system substrate-binding protein